MSIDSPFSRSLTTHQTHLQPHGPALFRHLGQRGGALLLLAAALALPSPAAALTRIELQAERVHGPGWAARQLNASWQANGELQLRAEAVDLQPLGALGALRASCRWRSDARGQHCEQGQVRLQNRAALHMHGRFALHYQETDSWSLSIPMLRGRYTGQDARERWVAEQLELRAEGELRRRPAHWEGRLDLRVPAGEALLDPVYVNFAQAPLRAQAALRHPAGASSLQLSDLQLSLGEMAAARGALTLRWPEGVQGLDGQLRLQANALAPFTQLMLQPFLIGSRLEGLSAEGAASASLVLRQGRPIALDLQLGRSALSIPRLQLRASGLQGTVHWRAHSEAPPSRLQWQALQLARIPAAGSVVHFRTQARDLHLLAPLRLPLLDGALQIHRLRFSEFGRPQLRAELDAELEPIDVSELCRALGWPVFGGKLSGRLPGLRIDNEVLSLDGALHARAFDGDIRLQNLRVLQPLGPLPRIAADIHLRRLDLHAVTQAFDFGRIEGRLDGDILGLRLLRGRPVAMDARLYSTPGDRSRRRISQRAIESISRAGGGPQQVLSRSALRLFNDFAYDRIGWRCVLVNGVCEMSGIEPANGGYLLVKGKWLPRIDVVGYAPRVNWNAFLDQLQAAIAAERAEIR